MISRFGSRPAMPSIFSMWSVRDEILGIFITQNSRRVADADGARNMSFGIGIGSSYVPNNGISPDGLGDIVAIDDSGGRSHGGLRPQERKRNENQTFHDEASVSCLLITSRKCIEPADGPSSCHKLDISLPPALIEFASQPSSASRREWSSNGHCCHSRRAVLAGNRRPTLVRKDRPSIKPMSNA